MATSQAVMRTFTDPVKPDQGYGQEYKNEGVGVKKHASTNKIADMLSQQEI